MGDISLTRKHGDTFILPVTLEDSAGAPVPITGATLKFLLGPYTQASEGVSVVRVDASGKFTYTVDAAQMEKLKHDKYYNLEVEITYSGGTKETLMSGSVFFEEDKIT
jgi:hypothetical protein